MRLLPGHKRHHAVTSPLVADAKEYTEEEIEAFVKTYYDTPTKANRDAAVMSFASIVRYITARYIGAFRSMASLEDDLITAGFLVVLKALDANIPVENICKVISGRIIAAQTREIHEARSLGGIGLTAQKERVQNGQAALYSVPISDEHEQFKVDEHLALIDLIDSLQERKDLTDLERGLIRYGINGRSSEDLAKRFNVNERTIRRAISNLIKVAKEELYAD